MRTLTPLDTTCFHAFCSQLERLDEKRSYKKYSLLLHCLH